jgi:hypothetical protein
MKADGYRVFPKTSEDARLTKVGKGTQESRTTNFSEFCLKAKDPSNQSETLRNPKMFLIFLKDTLYESGKRCNLHSTTGHQCYAADNRVKGQTGQGAGIWRATAWWPVLAEALRGDAGWSGSRKA